MRLSVVVPCHNEERSLLLFLPELGRALEAVGALTPFGASSSHEAAATQDTWSFELVLVDDGSTDGTKALFDQAATLLGFRGAPVTVHWVSFTRNFGKEAALFAGLERARGDLVAVMDADLQDPPSLLPRMVDRLSVGDVDVAAARRTTRIGEPVVRSWCARRFYALMSRMAAVQIPDGARDYRVMRRRVVDALLSLPERTRFSKGLFAWVGYGTTWVDYGNVERAAGRTSWGFWRLVRYALDGIVSFSTVPLHIASVLGMLLCLVALVAVVFIVVRTLAFGDPVPGWPSLACVIAFASGAQLLCIGIMGRYLAMMYDEVKARPLYLVAEEGTSESDRADSTGWHADRSRRAG